MPCQQCVGICKSTTFHLINKIMVLWCGQVIFFPIVDVGISLCNLLMNCRPHGKGSRNLPQQRRRGETTASQCDQILPSRKLSQPRWSLSRNTIIRLTLLPYTQFAITISPWARRYVSMLAATISFPRVSIFHKQSSFTKIQNMLS